MKSFFSILLLLMFCNMTLASEKGEAANWQPNLNAVLEEEALKLVGSTLFSIFIWDLYKSKLLTTSGKYPMTTDNEYLMYEIEYFKGISSEDLIERTIEQWQHLGVSEVEYRDYLPKLKNIWPDIKAGDTLTLVINKTGSAFYHNKKIVGGINKAEFGPLFLDIWLSEKTSEPTLRSELLGIKNNG